MERYGVREVCNVQLKSLKQGEIGKPVLYLDTMKTSGLEEKTNTVYAKGGQGNPRLLAFEGEKELTVNGSDALLSMETLALLLGTIVQKGIKAVPNREKLKVVAGSGKKTGTLKVTSVATTGGNVKIKINSMTYEAPVTALADVNAQATELAGVLNSVSAGDDFSFVANTDTVTITSPSVDVNTLTFTLDTAVGIAVTTTVVPASSAKVITLAETGLSNTTDTPVYVMKDGSVVTFATFSGGTSIEITDANVSNGDYVDINYYYNSSANAKTIVDFTDKFAGYYSMEFYGLWKRESDGEDIPVLYQFPRVKLQTNNKVEYKPDGDPIALDIVFDCFPNKADGKTLYTMTLLED